MATLTEEFNPTVTIKSAEEYIAFVLKLFARHKKAPVSKPGEAIYSGDCYQALAEAERRYIYQRGEKRAIELRPGIASKLTKAGILFRIGRYEMLEKVVNGERLVTFALP